MPRYAIIQDNTIVNLIVADADFVNENYPDAVQCDDAVGVGDLCVDGKFIRIVNIVIEDDTETL